MGYLDLVSDLLAINQPTVSLKPELRQSIAAGFASLPISLLEQLLNVLLSLDALKPNLEGTIDLFESIGQGLHHRWQETSSWIRRSERRKLLHATFSERPFDALLCLISASSVYFASGSSDVQLFLDVWVQQCSPGKDNTAGAPDSHLS